MTAKGFLAIALRTGCARKKKKKSKAWLFPSCLPRALETVRGAEKLSHRLFLCKFSPTIWLWAILVPHGDL